MRSSRANSLSKERREIWKVDGRSAAFMVKAVCLRLNKKFLNKIENLHCGIASSMTSCASRKAKRRVSLNLTQFILSFARL